MINFFILSILCDELYQMIVLTKHLVEFAVQALMNLFQKANRIFCLLGLFVTKFTFLIYIQLLILLISISKTKFLQVQNNIPSSVLLLLAIIYFLILLVLISAKKYYHIEFQNCISQGIILFYTCSYRIIIHSKKYQIEKNISSCC